MPLIDAALAFAITMLGVATVVTAVVNLLERTLKKLPKLLKQIFHDRAVLFGEMTEQFLNQELAKIVDRENQLLEPNNQPRISMLTIDDLQALIGNVVHLSNADLIDKLKQSKTGCELIANLGTRASQVFDEISRRYTAVEQEYSEIFRQKIRIVSTVVSLLIALIFNVDSINIVGAYIRNPAMSTAIAAKSDQALANYKAQLEKRQAPSENEAILKQLQEDQEQLQKEFKHLTSSGFPIGWSYFPYWPYSPSSPNPFGAEYVGAPTWEARLHWMAGIFLTSLLAGLGAPFWYDVIVKINQLTRGGMPAPTSPQPATP